MPRLLQRQQQQNKIHYLNFILNLSRRLSNFGESYDRKHFFKHPRYSARARPYNYPPKGRWIVVDIYREGKRRGIYPPLFTDPEGDSCFSIYQIRWIKKTLLQFFLRETTRYFSLLSQNSEYPRIFQVTGANQNARKLLSTDLVNTKHIYTSFYNPWVETSPQHMNIPRYLILEQKQAYAWISFVL